MNRVISLSVLLAMIALLGGMFFHVIAPFLLPLFLAAVLAVVCQPLHRFFLVKTGGRTTLAAALSTTTLVAILVIPLVVGTIICAVQLYSLADQHLSGDWHSALNLLWNKVATPALERFKSIIPGEFSDEQIAQLREQFGANLQSLAARMASRTFELTSSTVGIFVSLTVATGMFVTALYYFLADGPALIAAAEVILPLPVDHQRRLCERFAVVVRAVVTATFLAAFVQGLATALALQLCGIGYFWILLAIATVASLIPLVGAWIVWVPCAVWLVLQGHWGIALMLAVWGIAVVGMLDNVVKIYVLQSNADLHPLLAFVSVVGALQVMGLWGIFIGPIVASCLYALLQIFNAELKELTKERPSQAEVKRPEIQEPTPTTEIVGREDSVPPETPAPPIIAATSATGEAATP
jgi:predicted PurR-regulated permease PerM